MNGKMASLDSALIHWARSRPDADFLTEAGSWKRLTYAATLGAVFGFRRVIGSDRRTVVLALPGSIPAGIVWLAALGGGHRLVLCSPEAADDEKSRLARMYQPDIAIVDRREAAMGFGLKGESAITGDEIRASLGSWSSYQSAGAEGGWIDRGGELCLTTSGTTGLPKGVTLRSEQIAWTADQVRLSHRLNSWDRGLSVLPFFHINAPVVSLSATLLAGAGLVIAPRFSRSQFWSWIDRGKITWASVVPTIVSHLLRADKPPWLPGSLRFVRTASAPLPATWLRQFEGRFGIPVIETYGLSEAASQVAANPVPPGRHKAGSVGLPTGVEMRICEPMGEDAPNSLRDVARGEDGEICVAGPSVIAGYDGDASLESFVHGWFRTGDVGHFDSDGYLVITGRLRDVINRGGEKISPREIEEALLAHRDVRDVVVVAEPDPVYGQQAVAYVIPSRQDSAGLEARLHSHAVEHLARFKVPSRIVLVDDFPRTRTGKIQRHLLGNGRESERMPRAA